EFRIRERLGALRDRVRALAREFAVRQRERLLRHDAFLPAVTLEHVAVVEGGEERVLDVRRLREVNRAAQAGSLLLGIDARTALAEVETTRDVQQGIAHYL